MNKSYVISSCGNSSCNEQPRLPQNKLKAQGRKKKQQGKESNDLTASSQKLLNFGKVSIEVVSKLYGILKFLEYIVEIFD